MSEGPDLPEERPGRAPPADLVAIRQAVAATVDAGTLLPDPPPQAETHSGVRCLRFRPAAPARGTVVHFHGGGFRMGAPELCGRFAAALAERCAVEVVCPTYRLAPEHPLPAAIDDGMRVIRSLAPNGAGPLILSGDSAGGGLAASLAALSVGEGVPFTGLVLLSAWLDLTVTSPCYQANAASDPLFSGKAASAAAEEYLQGWPATNPLASPLFADVRGFPPTFISVGSGEVLADDARRFADRLRDAGVVAELSEVAGMEHTAVVRGASLPGAQETFDDLSRFIDRLLATSG